MAKNLNLVRQEIETIRTEVEDGANTAARIGGAMSGILEYAEEQRVGLKGEVDRLKEDVDGLSDEIFALSGEVSTVGGNLANEVARAKGEEARIEREMTTKVNVAVSDLNANTGISEYPAFDPADDYAVGDVVNYEGRLKRFIAEHAAGEWIGTDAEEWSERKELQGFTKEVSLGVKRSINLFNPLDIIDKQGLTNTGDLATTNYESWATSNYIPVKPDTDYHLSIQGERRRAITYILFDAEKTKIGYSHESNTFSTVIHTTEETAFIMFNVKAYGESNTNVMFIEGNEQVDYIPYNRIEQVEIEGLKEAFENLENKKATRESVEAINVKIAKLETTDAAHSEKFIGLERQAAPIVEMDFSDPAMWEAGYYFNKGTKTINEKALTYKKKIGLVPNEKIVTVINNYNDFAIIWNTYDINDNVLQSISATGVIHINSILIDHPTAAYLILGVLFREVEVAVPEEIIGTNFLIAPFRGINLYGNVVENFDKVEGQIKKAEAAIRDIIPIVENKDNYIESQKTLLSETIYGWYSNNGKTILSEGNTLYLGHTVNVFGLERVSINKYEVFESGKLNYAIFDSNFKSVDIQVIPDFGYKSTPTEIELPYGAYYLRFNSRATQSPKIIGYRKDFNLSGEKIKDASISKEKLNFEVPTKEIEVTIANSDKIGIIGDSYTESAYAVKGKSYISKLSLFSDYQFVNFGESGDIYAGRIADIRNKIPRYGTIPYDEQKTKYTMMCCYTNDIKYMSNSQYFQSLENAIKAVMGIGSIPIVCTEYHTNFSAKDKSQIRTAIIDIAKKYRLECWDIAQIVDLLYTTKYNPFWGGSHMGTRTNAMEADNYEKFLNNLEAPMQSIKIFNARNISDDYDDYMFTSNEERAKLFKEINVGAADLKNASSVDAIPGSSIQVTNSEYQSLVSGTALTINKVSLVSIVLPAFAKDIQKLSLSLDCSVAKVLIKDSMASPYPTVEKLSSFYVDFTNEPAVGDVYLCAEDNKEYTVVSHVVDEAGDYHLLCTPFVSSGFATTGTLTKVSGNGDATLFYSFREMGINPSNITEDTIGHWVELTGDGNGNYDISNLVDRCVDVDKCHFLIVSESDNLALNDIRIKAEIAKEKNIYRPEPYKFESTYNSDAEELLPASTFGIVGTLDSNWNVTPIKIYEDIQGVKSYPKGCSSIVKVTDNVNLSCTVDGSKLKNGTARLEVWCRYFPDIYTDGSGNQITENSYDYNDIIVEVGGQETTLTQRVNTYWKIVEFDVYTVKGSSLYLKIHSNNEGIEVARVSMKYI